MEGEAEKELNADPRKARRRLLRLLEDDDERKSGILSSASETRKTQRKQKPPASRLRAMPYSRKVSEDATKPSSSQAWAREAATDFDAVIAATVAPYVSEVKEHRQHHVR